MLETAIGRLRLIGMAEGISFLVLLGVAMPLKYVWGMALAVKVAGWLHGILFMVLLGLMAGAGREMGWSAPRYLMVFVASLIPFGPFVIDGRLKKEDEAYREAGAERNR